MCMYVCMYVCISQNVVRGKQPSTQLSASPTIPFHAFLLMCFLFLQWIDCDLRRGEASSNNQALMGYALRTMDFKYIAYFRFNRTGWQLDLGTEPHFQVLPNCGDLNLVK